MQAAPYLAGIANRLSQRWISTLISAAVLRWPQDFGQGDKLVPLERETGRDGQSDTQALRD